MKEREVVIRVTVGGGDGSATAFGCDLGYEYVRINGEYTT
jgi:glutamate N-acetyltransferase/amino-acid N-acetyltransferase